MEKFFDIPKFEGVYQVSNKGNIKRLKHTRHLGRGVYTEIDDKIRKVPKNNKIKLSDGHYEKSFVVSRLVYQVCNNVKLQRNHTIIHKDGNIKNNSLDNLKVITRRNHVSSYMNNSTGYTGVVNTGCYDMFTAKITFEGQLINLHTSKDKELCHKLYQAAKTCFEDYDRIKTSLLCNYAKNRLINKSVKLKDS